jgi:hypothetical protein
MPGEAHHGASFHRGGFQTDEVGRSPGAGPDRFASSLMALQRPDPRLVTAGPQHDFIADGEAATGERPRDHGSCA